MGIKNVFKWRVTGTEYLYLVDEKNEAPFILDKKTGNRIYGVSSSDETSYTGTTVVTGVTLNENAISKIAADIKSPEVYAAKYAKMLELVSLDENAKKLTFLDYNKYFNLEGVECVQEAITPKCEGYEPIVNVSAYESESEIEYSFYSERNESNKTITYNLDLGIPKGEKGEKGDTGAGCKGDPGDDGLDAIIQNVVANVRPLDYGETPTVNVESSRTEDNKYNLTFNFALPNGAPGTPGGPGISGNDGLASTIKKITTTTEELVPGSTPYAIIEASSITTTENVEDGTNETSFRIDFGLPAGLQGVQGNDGRNAEIRNVTARVETLEPGYWYPNEYDPNRTWIRNNADAGVEVSPEGGGNIVDLNFWFKIPRGDKGQKGEDSSGGTGGGYVYNFIDPVNFIKKSTITEPYGYWDVEYHPNEGYANVTETIEYPESWGGGTCEGMMLITYSELKNLRDNGELIPGMQYRMIDYETIIDDNSEGIPNETGFTQQVSARTVGNYFDIILVADSVNTLNENIRFATCYDDRNNSNEYFSNSNLAAWRGKYCLDNIKTTYTWANESSGKGVIYWMKDEWDNECPYDFKNIQFKRYPIIGIAASTTLYDYQPGASSQTQFDMICNGLLSSSDGYFMEAVNGDGMQYFSDPIGSTSGMTTVGITQDTHHFIEYSYNDGRAEYNHFLYLFLDVKHPIWFYTFSGWRSVDEATPLSRSGIRLTSANDISTVKLKLEGESITDVCRNNIIKPLTVLHLNLLRGYSVNNIMQEGGNNEFVLNDITLSCGPSFYQTVSGGLLSYNFATIQSNVFECNSYKNVLNATSKIVNNKIQEPFSFNFFQKIEKIENNVFKMGYQNIFACSRVTQNNMGTGFNNNLIILRKNDNINNQSHECLGNVFGNDVTENIFLEKLHGNVIGNYFYNNHFYEGSECGVYGNEFQENVSYGVNSANTFGNLIHGQLYDYDTGTTNYCNYSLGVNTVACQEGMMAVGRYNTTTNTRGTLFVVGNGTETTARTDAFIVKDDGNCYASGAYYALSDKRKKDVIDTISLDKAYELINKCQTILYTWKNKEAKNREIGLIAQEVQQYFPELVSKGSDGYLTMDYSKLSVILLAVIKDMTSRIKKLDSIEERLKQIENKFGK